MTFRHMWGAGALATLLSVGCQSDPQPGAQSPAGSETTAGAETESTARYGALERMRFNQLAVRLNLPVFWEADRDGDSAVDPDEVRALIFYPTEGQWVADGKFTPAFAQAYDRLVAAAKAEPAGEDEEKRRLELVWQELDQGAPTLIFSDFRDLPDSQKRFVGHILEAAHAIDELFATQTGMKALADRLPDDRASRSLFRRNWGPECQAPKTEDAEGCSAIPGSPEPLVDIYPTSIQQEEGFCKKLEGLPNASKLLSPFTVVRGERDGLRAVPYTEHYRTGMTKVARALRAAAEAIADDPEEEALRTYLTAAAESFTSNDWEGADEAWAAMNARNSKWYLRVAPDEVYWDPCSHKAGFHLTFARINPDSLAWQDKLAPLQQDMEQKVAELIGRPYRAREVSFHLPDFIDIVINAGDDRGPFGATIGQSLPNWGPVANEGRGRTVAMSNLYTDPDSVSILRAQAASLLDEAAMQDFTDDKTAALLGTILHEAMHNLGPSHEYRYRGKTDNEAFGGQLASMLEELKAQSGSFHFLQYLVDQDVIDEELQRQAYVHEIVWAFGHISRGMYTPSGERKPYSQLAAIQLGFLMDEGAVRFDPELTAANGEDEGAFTVDFDKLPDALAKLMKVVGGIKAKNDRSRAEALVSEFVDGDKVPGDVVAERYLRHPKASFVYAMEM